MEIVIAIMFGLVGLFVLYGVLSAAKESKGNFSIGGFIFALVFLAASSITFYTVIAKPVNKTKPAITATPVPIQSIIRKSDYDYEPEYIGNKHSYKFHYAWCSSVDDMYEGNKVYDKSREYLISHGYVPCKRCDP